MADGHALPELNWRLATSVPPTIEFYEGAVTFAEEVERMTNGNSRSAYLRVVNWFRLAYSTQYLTARSKWATTASYYYFGKNEAYALTPPYLSA